MQKVREIIRGGEGDGVETEACSLKGNSGSDRQSVKMLYWSDVNTWRCTDYKTDCTVLLFCLSIVVAAAATTTTAATTIKQATT